MLCQNQGVELDVCPNCSAHWFDPGELKQITGLLEDLPGLKYKSRKSRFICPNCDIPDAGIRVCEPQEPLVDQCSKCNGILLETGELDRAVAIAHEK